MEKVKLLGNVIENGIDSLPPWLQNALAALMGVISHLDTCASILALIVLAFQFKVVFLNGKSKQIELETKTIGLKLKQREYDKECKEDD